MARHRTIALYLGLLAITLPLAGCMDLAAQDDDTDAPDGRITAEHEVSQDQGLGPNVPLYHAEEVHRLTGEITLDTLGITLATVNGPINVTTDTGSSWKLVAHLTGYGSSQEEAQDQLDRLTFNWSIGTPTAPELRATIQQEGANQTQDNLGSRAEASLDLVIPEDLLPTLTATNVNGAVTIEGLQASELTVTAVNGRLHVRETQARVLTATSANGLVDVDVEGTHTATLSSTNGAIAATVRPGDTGRLQASSVNGGVSVHVPETASYGYDADATSVNGLAGITLQDGQGDRSGPGEASFRTDGYEDRKIRTTVTVGSTNGGAHLGPASTNPPDEPSSEPRHSTGACPLVLPC